MKIALACYLLSATAGLMSAQGGTSTDVLSVIKDLGGWGAFLLLVVWLVKNIEKKLDTLIEVTRSHSSDCEKRLIKIQSTLDDTE